MSNARPDPEAPAYIRGGGGVAVDGRLVVRVLVALTLVTLAVLVVVLSVAAVRENSRNDRLRRYGVPVAVTVNSCVGLASGTGVTAAGFTCKGSFAYQGHNYTDVIRGSAALLQPGQALRGVTDPRDPTVLSTVDAVANEHASWRAFIAAGICLLLLALTLALARWGSGRGRRPVQGRS